MSENITLNNGVEIPALGFGVFQAPPEETRSSVVEALRVGYQIFDTAAPYDGYDEALHAFDKSAGKLGVEQGDLLLHQPLTNDFDRTIAAHKAFHRYIPEA